MEKCHQSRLFYFFNFISLTKCNIWLILNIFTCVCHLITFHPKHSLLSLLYFVCFRFANAEDWSQGVPSQTGALLLCYNHSLVALWLRVSLGRQLLCYYVTSSPVVVPVVPVVVVIVAQDAPWLAVPLLLRYIHGPVVVLLLIPGNEFLSLCLDEWMISTMSKLSSQTENTAHFLATG